MQHAHVRDHCIALGARELLDGILWCRAAQRKQPRVRALIRSHMLDGGGRRRSNEGSRRVQQHMAAGLTSGQAIGRDVLFQRDQPGRKPPTFA